MSPAEQQRIIRTELELALDQAELRELRKIIWPKRERHVSRCMYCGRRCWGRACFCHVDLVQIEHELGTRA